MILKKNFASEANHSIIASHIFSILTGILAACFSFIVLSLIRAIIYTHTNCDLSWVNAARYLVFAFSILLGGYMTAKKSEKKGLLHGLIFGITFLILSFLISNILGEIEFFPAFIKIILALLCSALGGIFGIK